MPERLGISELAKLRKIGLVAVEAAKEFKGVESSLYLELEGRDSLP